MTRVAEVLAPAPYLGRGLLLFRSSGGELTVLYWLTGRRAPSRRRLLVGDGAQLRAVDVDGGAGDPLRHYVAAARDGDFEVIGNGDHVELLLAALASGRSPAEALLTIDAEPDPPLHTARTVAMIDRGSGAAVLGAARAPVASSRDHAACFVADLPAGHGVLLATYIGPAERPRTWAQPTWVDVADSARDQLEETWHALAEAYRVSIAMRSLSDDSWSVFPPRVDPPTHADQRSGTARSVRTPPL